MRLIDADDLKQAISKATYNFEQIPTRVDKVLEIIDNAPTLPQVTVFAENASKEEIEDFKQELENVLERPRGKWIVRGTEQGAVGVVYIIRECDKCGWSSSLFLPKNFCPNCGADMRGDDNG